MAFLERDRLKGKVEKLMLGYIMFGLLVAASLTAPIHAHDQSGFISIDCGAPDDANYEDEITGITYISDASFIDTGVRTTVAPELKGYTLVRQLENLRSFPEGDRNCYKIGLNRGTKYLMRAIFMYGNYDGRNKHPQFDLHLGPNKWATVNLMNAKDHRFWEIIHVPTMNYTHVCLVNTGDGTPFISGLEFRPLNYSSYVSSSDALSLLYRYDLGSTSSTTVRYPADAHDRFWIPYSFARPISTSQTIALMGQDGYSPPSIVMSTACEPINASEPLELSLDPIDPSLKVYFYLHFAEVLKPQANQSRQFNVSLNGNFATGPLIPKYFCANTIRSPIVYTGGQYRFSFYKTGCSTLPPIINAIEVYSVVELSQSQTDQSDVDAVVNIKTFYGIKRNWQGDPCAPQRYLWEGLNCSSRDNDTFRITSLNLSSYGLTGVITHYISDLTWLQSLDLSNNNLNGPVPDFLSQFPYLKILNLSGNSLTGSVPPPLIERSKEHSLELILGGNQRPCSSVPCKKKHKSVVPVVASVVAVTILVLVAVLSAIIFWNIKRRKQRGGKHANTNKAINSMASKNRRFKKREVLIITNNFERVLGKGGFGTVYHGYLDDTQVAVKMLSPLSVQGHKQFQAEVKLLSRVHHRNLTNLVGYCDEGTSLGLIYEYMPNGDLEEHLSDTNRNVLNWERRLQIAVDAAKGLEYLHNGCKPPVVHRDVKTSNILLNEFFQAKLADFGLSRAFPAGEDDGSHLSTVVVGTRGYLDPEYQDTSRLTEKSDVYSFGVVLLRIVTGKPAIARTDDRTPLNQWVVSMLANGDIQSIVDPRLDGVFSINSAWKAVEIAMACVSPTASGRPTMNRVVTELSECLEMAIARTNQWHENEAMISTAEIVESVPLAR